MAKLQSLHRAGTQSEGRGCFGRRSSTPGQPPTGMERDPAVTDNSLPGDPLESPAAGISNARPTTEGLFQVLPCNSSRYVGSFLVHLTLDSGKGSQGRKRWLNQLLYGQSSPDAVEDTESWRLNRDEDPDAGVREPSPKPLVPQTGTAAVQVHPNVEEGLV